ncbi:hypothetical protein GQ54DRAFT_25128 [Martensiomyces pterosporus]|nr:hypothetical protein GQ54DRAFT_25128 [Martensiomyces pterosporus]
MSHKHCPRILALFCQSAFSARDVPNLAPDRPPPIHSCVQKAARSARDVVMCSCLLTERAKHGNADESSEQSSQHVCLILLVLPSSTLPPFFLPPLVLSHCHAISGIKAACRSLKLTNKAAARMFPVDPPTPTLRIARSFQLPYLCFSGLPPPV